MREKGRAGFEIPKHTRPQPKNSPPAERARPPASSPGHSAASAGSSAGRPAGRWGRPFLAVGARVRKAECAAAWKVGEQVVEKKSERGARAFLRPLTLSAHTLKHARAAALQRERGVSRRGWCCDCCFASWCCCCSSPRRTLRQEKMKITCHPTTPIPFSLQPLFFRPLHQKKKTMASLCTMRSASAARLTSKVRGSRWRPTAAGVVGDAVIPHPSRAGRGARREGGSCHGTPPPPLLGAR